MSITGNLVGSYSQLGKTFIFADSEGNELTGVITDQMTILDVEDNDVRKGVIYAGDEGIRIGTQEFPFYNYALINGNGLCYEVCGTSANHDDTDDHVAISRYDSDYVGKYYNKNDGKWYLDASFISEFVSE